MRVINRDDQSELYNKVTNQQRWPQRPLSDDFFDGVSTPRPITSQTWLAEGDVHRERILSAHIDSTRYFVGPQISILRDDNRRITWAATVETPQSGFGPRQLMLHKFPGSWPISKIAPSPEHKQLAKGDIWRYYITLNKFTGEVTTTWITRSRQGQQIWMNGQALETEAVQPDFPFFEFSQPPIGHVPSEEPPFGILGYKCRKSGQIFIRRMASEKLGKEVKLKVGSTLGGISFAISGETVLARVDVLDGDDLVPTLITSKDSGKTFRDPVRLDMSQYEQGFKVVPGYTRPVVDVGGHLHVPIHVSDGRESVALNYVVREDALVEAIRVHGGNPVSDPDASNLAHSKASLEIFPATLGNPNAYGDSVTDGHGLIMVLSTEGRLYSSNSSAGGMYYPEPSLLNYEMPLIAAFATSECYTSGLKPNYVSMDYLYLETDALGRPISSRLHLETWDMPLPEPQIAAKSQGSQVNVEIIADADVEDGHVTFSFDDPSIVITDSKVTSLRSAVVDTNRTDLAGHTLMVDVDALFHRHYGEAIIR